jgi:cytochrome c oxidase assembly protein subunit 11
MSARYSLSHAKLGVISALLLGSSILTAAWAQAAGDTTEGRNLFAARCAACHDVHPTRKPGPLLSGVYGRRAGSVPGYHYSAALAGASIVWNTSNLNRWLSGPPAFIPGVNMQAKVDNAQERLNIIAYLKSLSPTTAMHGASASAAASLHK